MSQDINQQLVYLLNDMIGLMPIEGELKTALHNRLKYINGLVQGKQPAEKKEEVQKHPNEDKYVFFWQGGSPFSQWHKVSFKADGYTYTCAEQYMMHRKALLFNDSETAKKIMQAGYNPKKHKELGRLVKNFDAAVWNKHAKAIVYAGNYEKFTQNEKLLEVLKATKGKVIVEASPYDKIWGIGLSPEDPKRFDPKEWKGTNWLGEVLTTLCSQLVGA
jgi:ribA/ribD-fused uncharacterized protein